MTWPTHPAADKFPMLTGDEFRQLAEDIAENGLREPVWLWRDPGDSTEYLLDGRNRLAACAESGTEVRTQHYTGDDPITFVVSLNIHRRHLTLGQRAFLALELEPLYAAQAAKRMLAGVSTSDPSADLHEGKPFGRRAISQAGRAAGVSGRAVGQAKRIRDKAPDLEKKVTSDEIRIDRAERIIRDREAEQRRIAQAKAEAETSHIIAPIDIRHGDFREALSALTNIDAIITDPPYPREFIPLLGDLAAWADKILAPDGILAVLIGQSYLPEVYRLLDTGRPYRWTACYLTSGPSYVSHPRRVQSNWKPLIVYGGGPRFADVIRAEGGDADAKNNHKWGQDYSAFHTIVERLTERGQTVVDPFMGSGTTLLAAHALGRTAIGCDIEAEHVARARERLT